jgi:drug/metabolite transporter (DMT)-like permease
MKFTESKITGYILAVFSILIWGITFICTKVLLQDFSSLEILFIRFVIAYISLLLLKPKKLNVSGKDNLLFVFAGLSGVTVYQFAENIALNFTTASNVSIIVSISPMFTAILAALILKEKHLTFRFILGFIIAITGITFVSLNGQKNFNLNPKGDLLALFSAVCWSFYSILISLINKKGFDPVCSARRVFFFAIIFMLPLITGSHFFSGRLEDFSITMNLNENVRRFSKLINWINFLFLGIAASALCFSAWNKACKIIGTVKTTTGLYMIPVVTIIFAYIFLGEQMTAAGFAGAFLTILGLVISER